MEVKTQKISIRQASSDEIDILLRIEQAAWQEKAATREMLLSRMEVFPEGVFYAIKEGRIQGFAVNQIINYTKFDKDNPTWALLTDNGFMRKSHDYNGDSLYGISISVPPHVDDKDVALKLYEYGGKLTIKHNLKKVYIGSRIPFYHKYADKMSVDEYVFGKSKTGRILDPELSLYIKMGLKIEKIVPDFFNDPESLNYGVMVSWENPFYRFTRNSKLLARILSALFRL
jgi:hypothetical protein